MGGRVFIVFFIAFLVTEVSAQESMSRKFIEELPGTRIELEKFLNEKNQDSLDLGGTVVSQRVSDRHVQYYSKDPQAVSCAQLRHRFSKVDHMVKDLGRLLKKFLKRSRRHPVDVEGLDEIVNLVRRKRKKILVTYDSRFDEKTYEIRMNIDSYTNKDGLLKKVAMPSWTWHAEGDFPVMPKIFSIVDDIFIAPLSPVEACVRGTFVYLHYWDDQDQSMRQLYYRRGEL